MTHIRFFAETNLFYYVFIFGLCVKLSYSQHLPELLDPTTDIQYDQDHNDYVVVQEGKSFSVRCHFTGGGHLWRLPSNSDLAGFDISDFLDRVKEFEDTDDSFVRELKITEAKPSDTGIYTCYNKESEHDRTDLYIFVKRNDENVFLKPAIKELSVDLHNLTIPCKATEYLSSTSVSLYVNDVKLETAEGKYDPRFGFRLHASEFGNIDVKSGNPARCVYEETLETWESNILVLTGRSQGTLQLSVQPVHEWAYEGAEYFSVSCILQSDTGIKEKYRHHLNVTCPRCSDGSAVKQSNLAQGNRIIHFVNISSVTKDDEGEYICNWYQEKTSAFDLIEQAKYDLSVSQTIGQIKVEKVPDGTIAVNEGDSIDLIAHVSAFPFELPNYSSKWVRKYVRPPNKENTTDSIVNGDSLEISSRKEKEPGTMMERLTINGAKTEDSGFYLLSITVNGTKRTVEWIVNIRKEVLHPKLNLVSPTTWVVSDQTFYQVGTNLRVQCLATGLPLGKLRMFMKSHRSDAYIDIPKEQLVEEYGTYESVLVLNTTVDHNVYIKCESERNDEVELDEKVIRVADGKPMVEAKIDKSIHATRTEDQGTIYDGDDITLQCKIPNDEKFSLKWFTKGVQLENIELKTEQHSKVLYAYIRNISNSREGEYVCKVSSNGKVEELKQIIEVHGTSKPSVLSPTTDKQVTVDYHEETTFACTMGGTPTPEIRWYKDDAPLQNGKVSEDGNFVVFDRILGEDAGKYTCEGRNRAGITEYTFQVQVDGAPEGFSTGTFVWVSVLILLFVLCIIGYFFYVIMQQRKRMREQDRALGVLYDNLMKGETAQPQPISEEKIPLEQRVQHVAYNPEFEIERSNLEIGQVIGRGEYGCVTHGFLLKPRRVSDAAADREKLPVAIKMARSGRSLTQQKMMIDELKCMTQVKHPNVVSLIGAVTRRLKQGELYLVIELCELGSLKEYLARYVAKPSLFLNEIRVVKPEDSGYLSPNSATKTVYMAEENADWSNEMETDRLLENSERLATSDLISFAMQIANGMEYLNSLACFHRDLAARNILITKDRLCRIADFGLAKQEEKNYYRFNKSAQMRMPLRWMAPEAFAHHVYLPESDVWSFGIVLYEIFTLGQTPYYNCPDAELNERVRNGLRCDKPRYAHDDIYEIMKQCWQDNPEERPTFSQCLNFLREHLKLASPQLHDRLESQLKREWMKIDSYSEWRGLDQVTDGELQNVFVDRPSSVAQNGNSAPESRQSPHYVTEFPLRDNQPRYIENQPLVSDTNQ